MKKILTLLLFLTGVASLARHKYYLIQQAKTWYDAQTYCRATHVDLATINSDADTARLQTEAQRYQFTSGAWFGVHKDLHEWRWSYKNETVGSVTFWYPGQPDNYANIQECLRLASDGTWCDRECADKLPFICYDERNTGNSRYVHVANTLSWFDAQRYCRLHHTDLVSMRDATEKSIIQGMISDLLTWIGLSRITWKWLDQSNAADIPWMSGQPDNLLAFKDCGYLSKFQAANAKCSDLKPFFCHGVITGQQQIVRVKVQSDQNMNDPAVKAAVLEKIQQKLMEYGIEQNVTLKWRKQPGGDVFQRIKDHDGKFM